MKLKTLTNKIFFLSLVVLAVVITSCGTTSTLSEKNLSEIYRTGNKQVEVDFLLHHAKDSSSTLHFQIDGKELFKAQKAANQDYLIQVKIHYLLYPSFESKNLVDSGSVVIQEILTDYNDDLFYGSLEVPTEYGNRYVLKLITTDLLNETSNFDYIVIDKTNRFTNQNFIAIDPLTETPIFRNWFYKNEEIHLKYSQPDVNQLSVRFYDHEFDIAPPPFAIYNHKLFDYQSSKVFPLRKTNSDYFVFKAEDRGFYHIQADTSGRDGFTLFHYNDGFPKVNAPEEMVSALRFITSKKEFAELTQSENQKLALDQFWLKIADDPTRARELIKAYYNRVQNANEFYSCHKEGWKTDRGIIYVVFGPPDVVYKSSSAESWVYGEENNYLSITLNFLKVDNPFSQNDYTLKRAPIYKNQWYRAVDSWRQGRVTSLDY